MLNTGMGFPDGLDPATAAQWGAELALWHDRALNGATFVEDREIREPRPLKRRIKDAMLLRRSPATRRLGERRTGGH